MPKKLIEAASKWIIAGRPPSSRWSRSSAFALSGRRSRPRCRRGSSSGNGRIEGKLVDVAAKEPLRVKEILVDEGALVSRSSAGALDTITLDAELAEAKAAVAAAQERLAVAQASIVKQKSEIELAEIEVERSKNLVAGGRRLAAGARRPHDAGSRPPRRPWPRPRRCCGPPAQVDVAKANAATIQTRIDDATLKSPVTAGCCTAWPSRARCSPPAARR